MRVFPSIFPGVLTAGSAHAALLRARSGGDLPSLDLAFALDRSFTTDPVAPGGALITSRRGPAVKFSRATGATQVNAAGLIEYAPENLLVRSSEFSSATWSRTTVGLPAEVVGAGPSGESAWQLQPSGSNSDIGQSIIIPSGGSTYTFSVWLKSDTGSNVSLQLNVYDNIAARLRGSKSITVTSEWQRFEVSSSALVSGYSTRLIIGAFASWSTGENLLAYGAQLERAITARTYYPTATAAFYAPRLDHYPLTGVCKGLLIEESRENLKTYSENFSDATWGVEGASLSTLSGASPSGGSTITKITEDTSTGGHGLAFTLSSTGTITMSVFAKADGRQWLRLQGANINTWFDIVNGVTGTVGVGHVATITNYGNGWWRCSVTFTTAASSSPLIRLAPSNGVSVYTGDGTSGLYLWGAQLEAGAFPTSYIPTTSGTVACSADVCGPMLLGESFINQVEGTLVIELTREPTGSTSVFKAPLRVWASGATNDYAGIDFNDSAIRAPLRTNNTTIYQNNVTDTVFSGRKIAAAWQSGSSALVIDGVVRTTNTGTFSFPTPLDTLGFAQITNAFYNGRIARIQYFRKRLSNAKLQTLTAP